MVHQSQGPCLQKADMSYKPIRMQGKRSSGGASEGIIATRDVGLKSKLLQLRRHMIPLFRTLFWYRCAAIGTAIFAAWACFGLGDQWWSAVCELAGAAEEQSTASRRDAKQSFVLLSGVGFVLMTCVATTIAMLTTHKRQQSDWLQKIRQRYNYSEHDDALRLVANCSSANRELATDFEFPEAKAESTTVDFWRSKLFDALPAAAFYLGVFLLLPKRLYLSFGGVFFLSLYVAYQLRTAWFPRAGTLETLTSKPSVMDEAQHQYRASILEDLGFQLIDYRREGGVGWTRVVAIYLSRHGNVMVQLGGTQYEINSIFSDGESVITSSLFTFGNSMYPMNRRPKAKQDNLLELLDEHEQRVLQYLDEHEAIEVQITPENYRGALVHLAPQPCIGYPR